MLKRLIGRFRDRPPEDAGQREVERAEAAKLKDEQATNRAYVRFGPRSSMPNEKYDE